MHLNDGEIRAYQDQDLPTQARQRITAHLASCSHCQTKAQQLLARAQQVNAHLSSLQTGSTIQPSPPNVGRARLSARLTLDQKFPLQQEKQTMWQTINRRIPRAAWVTLAVIAVLAVALAFPSVRAVANSFLGLFRVEHIRVVEVNTEQLPGSLENSAQLENIFTQNVHIEERGESQEVASLAEASALAGFPLRLPTLLEDSPTLIFQPGGSVTFDIDLALTQAMLKDLGYEDVQLSAELDGASVKLEIPASVVAQYGDCPTELESQGNDPDSPQFSGPHDCTVFMQIPSPTITAPPGLNVAQIGEAYLQVLGMNKDEAAIFARNVDWTTTFVMPVPRNSTDYREVQVDGVTGTLIMSVQDGKQFALLWVKDGILYALTGPGDGTTARKIADSIK
jgi:hypothetical protein